MKKVLLVLLSFILTVPMLYMTATAQITPIADIQYNAEDPGGPSPLSGQVVTIQGVVTVTRGEFSRSYFFFQDKTGPWSGIEVYISGSAWADSMISEGDSLEITGTVGEYHSMTQLGSVTNITRLGTNKWIAPATITTADLDTADAYECVLVSVKNVIVSDATINPGSYDYAFDVDDGSGNGEIGTRGDDNYFYVPVDGDEIASITGVVMEYDGAYVLEPRAAYDFGAINGITMIQSVQQVRMVEDIAGIDTSYIEGDTVLVKGIVTVPSGLFYAGAGVTVYIQDAKGGPWSGVLAFADTPTGIDQLFVGDEIQVKAVVTEYEHVESGVSMTELRGVEAFELLSDYNPLPDPLIVDAIKLDSTDNRNKLAEKYEGVLVQVENSRVDSTVRWSAGIRDFRLDDGSGGRCWAESRSDSLYGYEPTVGTFFKSVTGVIYNRFGNYLVLPRFTSDLILISGPPVFSSVDFEPLVPTPADTMRITASVQDESQVTDVTLKYQVNGGGFQDVPMMLESGFLYAANIGPFADQAVVDYYVVATDDSGNVAMSPENAPDSTYSFTVIEPSLDLKTIAEAIIDANKDYVPDLKNTYVKVRGIITANGFADYYTNAYMQDKTAGTNLFVNGQFFNQLAVGDSVEVVGLVNHYNGLTEIQPDDTTQITILGKGKMPEPKVITCADLADSLGESVEGQLVMLKNITITSGTFPDEGSNGNVTITDATGSATLRIDYDTDIDGTAQPEGAFNVIAIVSQYDASVPQNSGYQLLPRSLADIMETSAVDARDSQLPYKFSLDQNYPNPFNPTTTIQYSIATACQVKLDVYNIMGQKVRSLINANQTAGYKVAHWDGMNDAGVAVTSGIYLYKIKAADFVDVKKMLFVR
ncbi:T9SS type A sorting domain-containing protein [candidate division KSB1 bacterium]|nr:T9SS type A sorting domain-containing protein [candidate division KSB1 bacterium]